MIHDDLIKLPNSSIIIDAIATFISNERDSQVAIAKENNVSEEDIAAFISFEVYNKRFRSPHVREMPCVLIYFDNANFPEGEQYRSKYGCNATLNIEMYTSGKNQKDDTGKIIKEADAVAEERLSYLYSQVFGILSSEAGYSKGTDGLVNGGIVLGWDRIAAPESTNETESVLGINLRYRLSFEENTKQISGKELLELYCRLKIREEFVDPLIQIKLKG